MFELFLGFFELFHVGDEIHMSEHAHDTRKAVDLADIQELECLHFEAKAGVDHEQYEIGYFGHINHRVEVVVTLDERKTLVLSSHDRDWSDDVVEFLARIITYEVLHENRFSNLGRPHERHDHWWRLQRRAVYLGHL